MTLTIRNLLADQPEQPEIVYHIVGDDQPSSQATQEASATQKIQDWVTTTLKGHNCPVCNGEKWHIVGELVEARPFRGGAIVSERRTYPFLMVVCLGCGHTDFYNAVIAGFVDKPKEQGQGG